MLQSLFISTPSSSSLPKPPKLSSSNSSSSRIDEHLLTGIIEAAESFDATSPLKIWTKRFYTLPTSSPSSLLCVNDNSISFSSPATVKNNVKSNDDNYFQMNELETHLLLHEPLLSPSPYYISPTKKEPRIGPSPPPPPPSSSRLPPLDSCIVRGLLHNDDVLQGDNDKKQWLTSLFHVNDDNKNDDKDNDNENDSSTTLHDSHNKTMSLSNNATTTAAVDQNNNVRCSNKRPLLKRMDNFSD